MPILGAAAPLPVRPRRVLVAGTSGAGKTTLASRVAALQVRAILAQRADLLVWLNLPRALVMRQVIRRTVRRRLARQVLWNGNREPPLWTILTDNEHVVRWAWPTHHKTATRVAALLKKHPDLVVVRLTSRNDVERWLAGPLQRTGPHQ